MEKIELNVFAIVGDPFCVAAEDGEKVFNQIKMGFKEKKNIILSFQNVEMLTSAFLNTAVGKLYGDYDEKIIKQYLSVKEITDTDKLLLKRVIDTAKAYYKDPDQFEESIRKIMEED